MISFHAMQMTRPVSFFLVVFFLLCAFPVLAFTPKADTDDPESFHSCFYLGNIVDDTQSLADADLEHNLVTFHDGRAIQLYAMGRLADGHTRDYIEANKSRIADFARNLKDIPEQGSDPDWYDGRVASLTGFMYCASDDSDGDGLSDTLPRASCPDTMSSEFPEGSVLTRIKSYLQPCCVLSGTDGDQVDFFPCALQ